MDTIVFPFNMKSLSPAGAIEGLAAAFGNIDLGGDKIIPGAFHKTIAARAGAPLPMLIHHDQRRPIGVWTDLKETPEGLYVKGKLTMSVRDAQEAHALATDGALTGLSIGYNVPKGGARYVAGGVRELTEVGLGEGSLVTIPMNPRARVRSVKSIANVRDLEELLREECDLSSRKAKAAAAAAWKAISQPDQVDVKAAALNNLFRKTAARIADGNKE